jgi:hypothetical protein
LIQAWRGWTATAATPTTRTTRALTRALTRAEWCAWQQRQRTLRDEERCHEGVRFTEGELARLSFVRWLYPAGRLGPRGHDNV